jgi:membrane protein DedA with SNARE-associated domain
MGRWFGGWISRRFGGSAFWINTQNDFRRNSRMSIFLTRFLFTGFAIPVNWMAGSSYDLGPFLMVDIPGEVIWIFCYGGLGYLFGDQWEVIGQFLSDFGGLVFGLVLLGGGLVYLIQRRRHTQAAPATRLAHNSERENNQLEN